MYLLATTLLVIPCEFYKLGARSLYLVKVLSPKSLQRPKGPGIRQLLLLGPELWEQAVTRSLRHPVLPDMKVRLQGAACFLLPHISVLELSYE